MSITLDRSHLKGFVEDRDIKEFSGAVTRAHEALASRKGAGAEFTGWLDLPQRTEDAFLGELDELGKEARENSDCVVSIGIGGSYLGIHASLEFLTAEQKIPVHFAGHNISVGYTHHLLRQLENKRVTVVCISKSGTTTEPALAFRIIRQFMQDRYGAADLKKRIICITDRKKGALRQIADKEGYRTYPIDDDIGGRFSVLSPVGLVPLAIAGIDIRGLVAGAREAQQEYARPDLAKNTAYQYAAARALLNKAGKDIEVLSAFYQRLRLVEEWWKQLAGESEGKNGQGLFPASLNFTADLHSMGQLIQEGKRNMFETFLMVDDPGFKIEIPKDDDNRDNFNCVAGKDLDWVNKQAYKATAMAHFEGGVPNMTITVPRFDAESLGRLYYFFEKAVAMTGYLQGVNPFDQPGVEAYKKKMFALLGRT